MFVTLASCAFDFQLLTLLKEITMKYPLSLMQLSQRRKTFGSKVLTTSEIGDIKPGLRITIFILQVDSSHSSFRDFCQGSIQNLSNFNVLVGAAFAPWNVLFCGVLFVASHPKSFIIAAAYSTTLSMATRCCTWVRVAYSPCWRAISRCIKCSKSSVKVKDP